MKMIQFDGIQNTFKYSIFTYTVVNAAQQTCLSKLDLSEPSLESKDLNVMTTLGKPSN